MARICIASIRYYYPTISIELVKDRGNGNFSTRDIQKHFNVRCSDLGIKKMGWSAAKFHYLLQAPKGKKVLMLDADIVFIGPFLEKLLPLFIENDYVVDIQKESDPYSKQVSKDYFETKKIESYDASYKFPGYFFNAGNIFVTTGVIERERLEDFFDPHHYPFWKNSRLFPMVDQSVYNYLLPVLAGQKKITLATGSFMLWSKSERVKSVSIEQIKKKELQCGLVHWAGDAKIPILKNMTRGDILKFFESEYFKKIKYSRWKIGRGKIIPFAISQLRKIRSILFPGRRLARSFIK